MPRPLTTIERSLLGMAERMVMNMVVVARCRGVLEPKRVVQAIRVVQARHELLRVRVVEGEHGPAFSDRDVPHVALRVIERRGTDHWRAVVREELDEPLDITRGPLVRFSLIVPGDDPEDPGDSELICTTDHVAADAQSCRIVLRDVLWVIGDPSLRLDPRGDLGGFEGRRSPRPARSRSIDAASRDRPAIDFVHRRIDRPRSEAFDRACRARQVDLQAALSAAAALALADVRRTKARTARIGCIAQIDLRPQLEPAGDHFGVFAWAPSTLHRLASDADFWTLATRAQARADFHRGPLALAGYRWLIDLHACFGATLDRAASPLRGLCDGLFLISDVGRLDLPTRVGDVEVESIGFFAMVPDVDFVLGVQSFAGQLELDFCHCPERFGPEAMAEVADAVEARLAAASGLAARGLSDE
ncbi:condensation domain-containing protein [Nannocystaceae bacterium ST9]